MRARGSVKLTCLLSSPSPSSTHRISHVFARFGQTAKLICSHTQFRLASQLTFAAARVNYSASFCALLSITLKYLFFFFSSSSPSPSITSCYCIQSNEYICLLSSVNTNSSCRATLLFYSTWTCVRVDARFIDQFNMCRCRLADANGDMETWIHWYHYWHY